MSMIIEFEIDTGEVNDVMGYMHPRTMLVRCVRWSHNSQSYTHLSLSVIPNVLEEMCSEFGKLMYMQLRNINAVNAYIANPITCNDINAEKLISILKDSITDIEDCDLVIATSSSMETNSVFVIFYDFFLNFPTEEDKAMFILKHI